MANELKTIGLDLLISDGGSPLAFDSIPNVITFGGFGDTSNKIDVTNFLDNVRRYLAGMRDQQDITFDINWVPDDTVHERLRLLRVSGEVVPFQISFPTDPATVYQFDVTVGQFLRTAAIDDVFKASVTLYINSEPVIISP